MGNDNKIMMNCDPKSATNMYTKKKWLTVALLLCLTAGAHAQQSVQFSQYIFNGISVNPAYAGYKDVLNLNAMYRQQWSGFPGAPTTGGVSLDGPLKRPNRETNVGLGVQAMMDNLGPQKAISLYGSYSYRIRLDEEDTRRFCLGIGIGATQYSLNGSDLEYIDQGDRIIPDGSASYHSGCPLRYLLLHSPFLLRSLCTGSVFQIHQHRLQMERLYLRKYP
jgi:type IX secretion system PorP/SprF family membrane protein